MTDYYEPIVYVVGEEEEGCMLKTILRSRLGISRKLLSRLKLTDQGIMLNKQRVYINAQVHVGDNIEVRMVQETSQHILPELLPLQILYEDAHILIVNKSAGMVVHPTHGHYTGTVANAVVYYWQKQGQQFRFRPMHRLDRDTSGVLAIAKNAYVHQHVSEQFRKGTVHKTYVAWVHGIPSPLHGEINAPIDRHPLHRHMRTVIASGYDARTVYNTEEKMLFSSRLKVKLYSGRTHQIRVHMLHIGCPLIGDKQYVAPYNSGNDFKNRRMQQQNEWISRQALHAFQLSFVHPVFNKQVTFTAPIPKDLQVLNEQLMNST